MNISHPRMAPVAHLVCSIVMWYSLENMFYTYDHDHYYYNKYRLQQQFDDCHDSYFESVKL